MATLNDWSAYINLLHEMAHVEDLLRTLANTPQDYVDRPLTPEIVLWERFGVDV